MSETELVVSFWDRGAQAKNGLNKLLSSFSSQSSTLAHTSFYNSEPWREVATMMLQGIGPGVSEIGSTWVKSLAAANALCPVPRLMIESLGGKASFIYTTDQNADETAYSIPFLAETRVIYYRKDTFAKAGIDESAAFSTPQKFLETLEALRQDGIEYPLLFPLANRWLNLSVAASWVWGAGGDFIAEDGKSVIFDSDAALAGLHDFFSMAKYINPATLDIKNPDDVYSEGGHVITIGSPWLYNHIITGERVNPDLRENIDVALPPGPSYLGGTSLAVWKHSRKQDAAFRLVQFLTSPEAQSEWKSGILPARRDVLKSLAYSTDLVYKKMVDGTLAGRAFSSMPLWGVVEERLSLLLHQFWGDCIRNPELPAMKIIKPHLNGLARRLAITLES